MADTSRYLVHWHKKEWPYDDPALCGSRNNHETLKMSWEECWNELPSEFWETIPKFSWADKLLEIAEKYAPGEVYFLTSPIPNGVCAHGKTLWINENYPEYKNKLIIGHKKYAIVDNNSLLIDDSYETENKFENRGKRNNFILFPSYLNRHHSMMKDIEKDPEIILMVIENYIQSFINEQQI